MVREDYLPLTAKPNLAKTSSIIASRLESSWEKIWLSTLPLKGAYSGNWTFSENLQELHQTDVNRLLCSTTKLYNLRLLPVLSLMYLFNSLDRSNLGMIVPTSRWLNMRKLTMSRSNAKTDGIEDDLGLVGYQYSLIVVVFSVTFCALDLPSNLLLKRFSGRLMLPLMMFGWYEYFLGISS